MVIVVPVFVVVVVAAAAAAAAAAGGGGGGGGVVVVVVVTVRVMKNENLEGLGVEGSRPQMRTESWTLNPKLHVTACARSY